MNTDFTCNFKKINKKNPTGISIYENNYSSDIEDSKSDLDLESDSDDDSGNFNSEENTIYTESDTDTSSVYSDTEEDVVKHKNTRFRPKSASQPNKFKLLQEESDFEEES